MTFLDTILKRKRTRIDEARACQPFAEVRASAIRRRSASQPHAFRKSLQSTAPAIIAEIKRASPSKGLFTEKLDVAAQARAYRGAAAVSVLTEEDFFLGSLADIETVRQAVGRPVLCKDFFIDEHQIYQAAEAGADALLLIAAALQDQQLSRFLELTESVLGMDALVEVHNRDELGRALDCKATLIGVNNRDLQTFDVSLDVSIQLASGIPPHVQSVSESGLQTGADIRRLLSYGYDAFLIGECLMRAQDPERTLSDLIREAKPRVKVCGITTVDDALACVDVGVDIIGLNFFKDSPRYIAPAAARTIVESLPAKVMTVGIFVNEPNPSEVARLVDESGVNAIQLHGDEPLEYCRQLDGRFVIKALPTNGAGTPAKALEFKTEAVLLDAVSSKRGGTGETCDWSIARDTSRVIPKLFLAGGLSPENVADAIAEVRPYAVDVCSSLESSPGRKSVARIKQFMSAVNATAQG